MGEDEIATPATQAPDPGNPSPDADIFPGNPSPEAATPEVATPEVAPEVAADGETSSEPDEAPWWDDPSLPWGHKPTQADLACWALIAIVGIWALATIPLRTILIGWNPPAAAMIMGGRTSVVATGAWTRVYGGPIILYWLLAALSLVKFSWVYWWAGKLWGSNVIALFAGKSERAKKRADNAVRITNRFRLLAIFLSFLPIPFPMPIVFAAIGAAGAPLRRFLPPVIATSALFQAGYLALGWWIGQPAVDLVNLYAKYMWYATLAVLAAMVIGWWWRRRKARQETPPTPRSDGLPRVAPDQ